MTRFANQSYRWVLLALLAVVLGGCACAEPVGAVVEGAADLTLNVGEAAVDVTVDVGEVAVDATLDIGEFAVDLAIGIVDFTIDVLDGIGNALCCG